MSDTLVAASLTSKLERARVASRVLATTASGAKDAGLEAIARAVETGAARILPAKSSTSPTAVRTDSPRDSRTG